jgi:hypothetical protein
MPQIFCSNTKHWIWFEKYNIGYVCTTYIQFEEYVMSARMTGDKRMSMDRVDGRQWTEGARQMESEDRTRRMDIERCKMELSQMVITMNDDVDIR